MPDAVRAPRRPGRGAGVVAVLSALLAVAGGGRRADAAGASGILDSGFGNAGVKVFSLGSLADSARAVALQPDGKILVAGSATAGPVGNDDFTVVRLQPDGSFDTGFGGSGRVTLPVLATLDRAVAMALQADGKILLAGFARGGGLDATAVVRLQPDGSVDPEFGSLGRVVSEIGVSDSRAQAVAVQPDGGILVAGWARNEANRDVFVARYLPDGTLDPAFGIGGVAQPRVGPGNDEAYGLALEADGDIVVVGQSADGGLKDLMAARLGSDGSLDTGFAANGVVRVRFRNGDSIAQAAAIDPIGRILVVGRARVGNIFRLAVVRLLSDGGLDASLASAGRLTTPIGSYSEARAVAAFPDRRFAVVGMSRNAGNEDAVVVRYDEDGSLDTHFAGTGAVLVPTGGGPDLGTGVAIQPDRRIVVAGTTRRGNDDDFFVARYLVDDCGNGVVDDGEGCDGGPAHAAPCCSDSCTVLVAGTPCRAALDACDLADACDGASGACIDVRKPDGDGDLVCDEIDDCPGAPDPAQLDGDDDGLGDACDPCTSGSGITGGRIQIAGFLTEPGDDSIRFVGKFAVPTPTSLAPLARGLRLVVEDAEGAVLLDESLPAGAYSAAAGRGWTANATQQRHTWRDQSPGALVTRVRLRRSAANPKLVRFLVRAAGGAFAVRPLAEPIRASIVLDPPRAAGEGCPQFGFGAPPPETCAFDETGDRLACH